MDQIKVIEIFKETAGFIPLSYQYITDSYYDITNTKQDNTWNFSLELKRFDKPVEKTSESTMFESHVENPKAFKVVVAGHEVAFMQLGHDLWNNRVRIWELLVRSSSRRMNIGSQLMDLAKIEATKLGARALVLETQSCNVPAINFYLKHGFQLIGFDLIHYSNDDQARKEVRVEFGFSLRS